MLLLSLLGFWLYPVLPPRLLPAHFGFFDAARYGGIGPIGKAEAGPIANAFAAMPSLHIGWSSWCAFAAVPVIRRRWVKALLVAYPFCTMFAVVVTANHYVLDGVGGLANLGLAYLLARLVTRPKAVETGAASESRSRPATDRTTTGLRAP
jgi:membrane-associated phospholipid phosphatase